jgi:large subunit ribosomal protein L17
MAGNKKLGRDVSARKALLRSMVTSFLDKERIETTAAKAEEVQKVAERYITMAKTDNLANRRHALAFIYDEAVVKKLFEQIAPKYAERAGGYTRAYKTGIRKGDAAPLAIIELV